MPFFVVMGTFEEDLFKWVQTDASLFRFLQEATEGYWVQRWNEPLVWVSPALRKWVGNPAETWSSLPCSHSGPVWAAIPWNVTHPIPQEPTPLSLRLATGSEARCMASCRVHYDSAGHPVLRVVGIRAVTASPQGLTLLEQCNQQARIGYWEIDFNTQSVFWSDSTRAIHEVPPDFEPNLNEGIEFYEEGFSRDEIRHLVERAMRDGVPYDTELTLITYTGNRVWVRALGIPEMKDGACIRLYGTFQDIHERKLREDVLRVERDKLENVLRASELGTWEWDLKSGQLSFNEQLAQMMGETLEGLGAVTVTDHTNRCHPEDVPHIREALQRCFTREVEQYKTEFRLLHKKGHWVWIEDSGRVLQWSSEGEALRMFGIYQDISERKSREIEEAHAYRQHLLRDFFTSAPFGIALNDFKTGGFIDVNPSLSHLTGYTPEELGQLSYWTLTPNEYAEQEALQIRRLEEDGTYGPYEKEYIHKEGHRIPVRLSGSLAHDPHGNTFIWSVVEDIRQERARMQQLEESRNQVASLISNVPGTTFRCAFDEYWTMEFISPQVEALAGYPASSFLSRSTSQSLPLSFESLIVEEDRERARVTIQQAVDLKTTWNLEYRIRHRDGGTRWILERGNPIFAANGTLRYLEGVMLDVTESKLATSKIAEAEVNLRAILESTDDYILLIGQDGRVKAFNPAYAQAVLRLTEVHIAEGLDILELFRTFGFTTTLTGLEDALKGIPSQTEFLLRGEGDPRWFVLRFYPVRNAAGEVTAACIVSTDITHSKQSEQELLRLNEEAKQAKANVTAIIENTPDSIWAFDEAYRIVYINNTFQNEFLSTFGVWMAPGDSLLDSLPEFLRPFWKERYDRVLNGEQFALVDAVEYEGQTVFIQVAMNPIRKDGVVVGGSCFGANITERKQAEKALHETNAYLDNLFNHANAPIIVWDPAFLITRFNHAFEELTGWQADEVLGKTLDLLFPPDSAPTIMGSLSRTMQGERLEIEEIPILHRNQTDVYTLLWNSATLYAPDGITPMATIAQGQDITARKSTEAALRESEARFRNLMDEVEHLAVQGYAPDGTVQYWNTASERLYGFTKEEALGRNLLDLIIPEAARDVVGAELRDMARTGIPVPANELLLKAKDGSPVNVLSNHAIVKLPGKEQELFCIDIDIAQRKRAEAALQEATQRAEAANKAKSEFLANMSHEIRTPLNGVIGFTDLLLTTHLSPVQQQYVRNAHISGHTLLGIINDVLDFSKIEAGKLELDVVKTDLLRLLGDVADMLSFAASDKGLELVLDIAPDVPRYAWVDPVRLRQVLANLVGNAVKFTEAGEVEVCVSVEGSRDGIARLLFEVRDTGIGIAPEQQSRLFQSFSQADSSTTRKFGGTGLGLVISKKLVEKMHGDIRLTSAPGLGSTFSFSFETRVEDEPVAPLPATRCLVVGGHPRAASVLERQLRRLGMQEVVVQEDIPHEPAFGVILVFPSQNALPHDTPFPELHRLRDVHPNVPAVVLHRASDRAELHELCARLSISHFLVSPVKQDDLYVLLKHALSEPNEMPRSIRHEEALDVPLPIAPTLLLVDDVPLNATLLKAMVRHMVPRARLLEARNGEEALALCADHEPDLVLMDVQMPIMDGLEATRRLRSHANPVLQAIPVLALTAGATREEQEACQEAGMNGYLTKPIEPALLREALATHLDVSSFNFESVVACCSGDADLAKELLHEALSLFTDRIGRLRVALQTDQHGEVRTLAHEMRGVALNLGLENLPPPLSHLEHGSQPASEALETLERMWLRLSRGIRQHLRVQLAQ